MTRLFEKSRRKSFSILVFRCDIVLRCRRVAAAPTVTTTVVDHATTAPEAIPTTGANKTPMAAVAAAIPARLALHFQRTIIFSFRFLVGSFTFDHFSTFFLSKTAALSSAKVGGLGHQANVASPNATSWHCGQDKSRIRHSFCCWG
jgi:hypothetical protein